MIKLDEFLERAMLAMHRWSSVFFFVAGLLAGFGVLTCTGLIGDVVLVKYDLPGPPLWHERLILTVGAAPGHYAVLTPDGDVFVEELRPDNDDIAEFRAAPGLGVPPQDIPLDSVYRFQAVPTAAEMIQHVRDGALQAGVPVPAAPVVPVVGAPGAAPGARHPPLGPAAPPAGALVAVPPPMGAHLGPAAPPPVGAGGAAAPGAAAAAAAAPGPAGAAAVAGSPLVWVAAEDTQDISKGIQIPALPDAAVTFGDRGIIPYGIGHLFVQRMAEADIYRYVHDDLRVLPVVVDASGERKVSFSEAVSAMDPTPPRGGTNPALAQYVANQLKDQEIFKACAAVVSYSSSSTAPVHHKSSDPSMPIDMARQSRGIDLAIFFLCLQLMPCEMCLSKFCLLIEPFSAESDVPSKRQRLEDVLDQEGRQVPVVFPYCDNLIVMDTDKDSVSNVKRLAVEQLRRVGFQVHEEVEVTTFFESLGYLVDGKRGGVFPIPHRLEKAVAAFTHLRRRPHITGWQISKALGYVTPIFLLTRSMFSLPNALYQFMHENWSRKRRLWHSAALECKWISVLLPLAWADLRMPWTSQVKATDASLSGYAVGKSLWNVSDVVEAGGARERFRYRCAVPSAAPRRAALGTLDPFQDLETVKPIVDRFEPSPYEPNYLFKEIPEGLLQDSMWKTSYAAPFVFKEGIGDLESRATVSGVKHTLRSSGGFRSHHLHLGDNLGNVLGQEKGRMKNFTRLVCCRRLCALELATSARIHHRWIPSERNPVDKGSRLWEHLRREMVGSIGIRASRSPEAQVETFLEANAVTERTHAMYVKRVADFESWVSARGLKLTSAKLVDCALVDYLNQLWIDGADIGEATGTYAAWVKLRPSFSKKGPDKLVRTMKALQGFNRLDPGRTRPPLPLAFAALIAVELVGMGLGGMALAVMLMFSAYLRPIELLSLQLSDVLVPTQGSPYYAIHLHRAERGQPSKVGLYDETLLLDSSALPFLGYLLDAHRAAAAGPALFDFDYRSFNESFRTAARTAGLAAIKPDLYQLRHGGPSHDILNRLRSKAEVKDRGRWRDDRSVRRYEAHGRLQLQEKLVSEATQSRAAACLADLEAQLRSSMPQFARAVPSSKGIEAEAWDVIDGPSADILTTANRRRLVKDFKTGRALGNRLWVVTFRIICQLASLGVPVVLENPFSSRIWITKHVSYLIRKFGARLLEAHYCQYGTQWKKPTGFLWT
ncbi:unnamed protein product [Prorocentrum cordatum]|uniref:CDAN1-interacting nuclease 1 n=1 Tax=Prorocentrum cordatum TaxID=2364126 RepID=A0ABN9U1K1_9DINO|nr:unnamed protein product [Polarella glacialis]